MPKDLFYLTNSIGEFPNINTGSPLHLFLVLKCIATVLLSDILKPFFKVQSTILFIQSCNFLSIVGIEEDLKMITKSSTYKEQSIPGKIAFTMPLSFTLKELWIK